MGFLGENFINTVIVKKGIIKIAKQLEHREIELGLLTNYRLRKLYDEYKNS